MKLEFWAWSVRLQRHILSAKGNCPALAPDAAGFTDVWRDILRSPGMGDRAADEMGPA